MKNYLLRSITNIILVIATITINILANVLPFNGLNTGQISDQFKVYFVPAGYVFAIWGIIYIGMIVYAIYQALPANRENPRLRSIDGWFALSSLANMAWLFAWHYQQFPLTLIIMLLLLVSLVNIYLRLEIGKESASTGEVLAVRLLFSIYLGWITVATIANVSDVLYYLKWDGWGISPEIWMYIVLGAVAVISGLVSATRRDIAYTLVILWALVGITVKQSGVPSIVTATWITAVLVGLALLAVYIPRQPVKAAE